MSSWHVALDFHHSVTWRSELMSLMNSNGCAASCSVTSPNRSSSRGSSCSSARHGTALSFTTRPHTHCNGAYSGTGFKWSFCQLVLGRTKLRRWCSAQLLHIVRLHEGQWGLPTFHSQYG